MTLHEDFFSSLPSEQQSFTYAEAKDWLSSRRFGKTTYQAQVYDLLINPLLQRGLIERISRGFYILLGQHTSKPSTKEDEFGSYLKGKGVR